MGRKSSVSEEEPQMHEVENITDRIRERAYELYQLRGEGDGHDLDDWLIAESQLLQQRQAQDS